MELAHLFTAIAICMKPLIYLCPQVYKQKAFLITNTYKLCRSLRDNYASACYDVSFSYYIMTMISFFTLEHMRYILVHKVLMKTSQIVIGSAMGGGV